MTVLLLSAPAAYAGDRSSSQSEVDTIVECKHVAENEDSRAVLIYHPEEISVPVSTSWEYSARIEEQGIVVLRSGWHLPGYQESFESHAQFSADLTAFATSPRFARVEIHPWAFRYNHWGMRFGTVSERVGSNRYSATGHWPTLVNLEELADKLFIRIQAISYDPANANSDSNAVMSVELPEGLFARANQLVADATSEGNALLAADKLNCIDKPNPPILVT